MHPQSTPLERPCETCGILFIPHRTTIRRSGGRFCSRACHREMQRRSAAVPAAKQCPTCQRTLPLTHEYWHRNRSRPDGFTAYCRECNNAMERARRNRLRPAPALHKRRVHAALRYTVLSHYSQGIPHCACCGEDHLEFLTIDHLNGDGHQHRERIGTNSGAILRWLRRHGYPEDFAVLCYNCNCAKAYHGACPHEAERTDG